MRSSRRRIPTRACGSWCSSETRLLGPVIAVTGSSGKTTAKTFLSAALEGYAPPGSFNNHIGVPLSLANAWRQAPAGIRNWHQLSR